MCWNPERVPPAANPFRVEGFLIIGIPWLSLRSNHGLKLANAFGVSKQVSQHSLIQSGYLVTHRINDDVHADLVSHETELRGIAWIVDPFPGVAQVAVAGEKNH